MEQMYFRITKGGSAISRCMIYVSLLIYSSVMSRAETPLPSHLSELSLEKLMDLDVTIATGSEKPLSEAPAIASVITAADIEAMGATTLEEALDTLAGFHVSRSGIAYTPKYQVRGITSFLNTQTLVMINGVPIERNVRLGVLPVKMISRIEVIRGPASALYGADALAGVINVVTKDAAENLGTEMGVAVGGFNTHHAWFSHGEVSGDLRASIMVDYMDTDGHKREINADDQTALDRALGTQASLAPGPVNLSGKRVGVFLDFEKRKWRLRGSYYGMSNAGSGQGITEALSPGGRGSFARMTANLVYQEPILSDYWSFRSELAYDHGSQEIDKNNLVFPAGSNLGAGVFPDGVIGNPEFWQRQFRFNNSVLYTGFSSHRFRIGLGYFLDDLYRVQESRNFTALFAPRPGLVDVTDTSESYLPEKMRYSFYGYVQDEWELSNDWELTVGTRLDHYSDFGRTLNPRGGLVWKTTPNLTTKFLYGRAFRAPTFNELYNRNNPTLIGNPNLRPETINTYELAWVYRPSRNVYAGLTLFHYDLGGLINFTRDVSAFSAIAQNSVDQRGNGLEFELKVQALSELFLTGNYAFTRARDKNQGKPVGDYPIHKAYARADWNFKPAWNFGSQLTWVGIRHRTPMDSRPDLPGYTTVDIILRRRAVSRRLGITTSVRNLFDADVREPSNGPAPTAVSAAIPGDLPQAGRSAYVEIAWQFGE